MKKILIALVAVTLVSCGTTGTRGTNTNVLYNVLSSQEFGGASIRFYEILSEPNEIAMLQNDPKLQNKISNKDVQTSNFVVLNMGEKTSGGYSIGVDNVVETDTNIVISVQETTPRPDSFVTQAFTNPFCVVKINSKKPIIFK